MTGKLSSDELFTTAIDSDKSILINIKEADAWGLGDILLFISLQVLVEIFGVDDDSVGHRRILAGNFWAYLRI